MVTINSKSNTLTIASGLVSQTAALASDFVERHGRARAAAVATLALVGAGLAVHYYLAPWTSSSIELTEILDGDVDGALSCALVEEATVDPTLSADVTTLVVYVGAVAPSAPTEPIKRRVKTGRVSLFKREVLAAVKAKFGTPKRTEANVRAVRRYATDIMKEHNLRHTHLQMVLPGIVEASFTPDKYEVEAANTGVCWTAQWRRLKVEALRRVGGLTSQ